MRHVKFYRKPIKCRDYMSKRNFIGKNFQEISRKAEKNIGEEKGRCYFNEGSF